MLYETFIYSSLIRQNNIQDLGYTYMSAFWMHTMAIANLCNSPPDKSSTFLSLTFRRSERINSSIKHLSSGKQTFLSIVQWVSFVTYISTSSIKNVNSKCVLIIDYKNKSNLILQKDSAKLKTLPSCSQTCIWFFISSFLSISCWTEPCEVKKKGGKYDLSINYFIYTFTSLRTFRFKYLNSFWNLVHILRFDKSFQIIF